MFMCTFVYIDLMRGLIVKLIRHEIPNFILFRDLKVHIHNISLRRCKVRCIPLPPFSYQFLVPFTIVYDTGVFKYL